MIDLKNKWILITGASSGIGMACAECFAGAGMNLVITARREERLTALAETLKTQYNIQVETFCFDIRDALSKTLL